MTREEVIAYWKQRSEVLHNWLKENEYEGFLVEYVEAIDMAIEALSLSGDIISRADAIEAMGEEPLVWQDTYEEWEAHEMWEQHINALKALPSAKIVMVGKENNNGKERI